MPQSPHGVSIQRYTWSASTVVFNTCMGPIIQAYQVLALSSCRSGQPSPRSARIRSCRRGRSRGHQGLDARQRVDNAPRRPLTAARRCNRALIQEKSPARVLGSPRGRLARREPRPGALDLGDDADRLCRPRLCSVSAERRRSPNALTAISGHRGARSQRQGPASGECGGR